MTDPLSLYLALSGWVAAAVIFLGWRQHVNQLKDNLDGFRATNSKLALENSELKRKHSRRSQPRKENGQFAGKLLTEAEMKECEKLYITLKSGELQGVPFHYFSNEAFNGEMGRK